MSRAIFLDRDGVINRKVPEGQYVTCWEAFLILPGVVESIALLNQTGFRVIVATNQRCIAKGLMTTAQLEAMHQRMSEFLARRGARIDAIYYCPHEMEPVCRCRKPAPGMLLDAARDHGIDMPASWMIGDSDSDIEAGKKAGCKTAKLSVQKETGPVRKPAQAMSISAEIVAPSLLNAVGQILQWDKDAAGSLAAVNERQGIFQNARAETKRDL
jgi:D-glycero-D-manno-heptose 1,7-bisphosphate phosphatase